MDRRGLNIQGEENEVENKEHGGGEEKKRKKGKTRIWEDIDRR